MGKGTLYVRAVGTAFVLLVLAGCGTDAKINERVEARLSQSGVPMAHVRTSTSDRIVRLEGVVDSATERDQLERVVRDTNGVLAVDNRLVVKAGVTTTGAP